MEVLTGLSDPHEAARQLHEWGVKEVLVTLGSMGSLIFDGKDFYRIPAYKPKEVVDATGCGYIAEPPAYLSNPPDRRECHALHVNSLVSLLQSTLFEIVL